MKNHGGPASLLVVALAAAAWAQEKVPCEIVVPVLDAHQAVATAFAPGGQSYPVFRAASAGPLVDKVRHELDASFAQQVLRLDRYARNLAASQRRKYGAQPELWLTSPMYLLLSTEEGGFARFGFWLEDAAGKRALILTGYVDLVVTEDSVETGDFEEIFSHELGHLILKALTGGVGIGPSTKMHQSMAVTDYPTAIDEGFAEHFQPLVRDASANPYLRKLAAGNSASDLELLWLSAADGQLRTDGVKRNLFIHRKPLPAGAFDSHIDLYRLFVEAETSTVFDPTALKNGQEMMASEGVIATIFYRLVNDPKLREHFREPAFYGPFLDRFDSVPEKAISPFENVNLKLFAALTDAMRSAPPRAPLISLVENYARLFPDETKRVVALFVETTWGATVSQPLTAGFERAAADGGRGDIEAFRHASPFPLLDLTIAEVVDGKRALDANLGPEFWLANLDFKIASPLWSAERAFPLTLNLNTASEPELMTIPGVDLATARKLVAARRARGFFQSIDDLASLLPPDLIRRMHTMAGQMGQTHARRE